MDINSHYFEICNYLNTPIQLSPVSLEETSEFKLCGEVIIKPSSNERIFPKISLENSDGYVGAKENKCFTAKLSELDFASVGLSDAPSIVQRLKIVDTESGTIAGYLSFIYSVFQITPNMTWESCTGYDVSEKMCPFGGALLQISVKKDPEIFDLMPSEKEEEEKLKNIIFKKLHKDSIVPKKSSDLEDGYDLFSYIDKDIIIEPLGKEKIPTGISVELPHNTHGRVAQGSELTLNKFLNVVTDVFDEGFKGEISVILFNNSKEIVTIKNGDKIARLIIEKTIQTTPIVYEPE